MSVSYKAGGNTLRRILPKTQEPAAEPPKAEESAPADKKQTRKKKATEE